MRERILWADVLKGWLMVFVVLGHAILDVFGSICFAGDVRLFNIIYSFHMPAFMSISGYFMRNTNGNGWNLISKRFLQLMVPFSAWTIILFLLGGNYNIQTFFTYIMYPDSSLWFLWALFWIAVLFVVSEKVASVTHVNELIGLYSTAIILLVLMAITNTRIFGFQFVSYYFLFFIIGYTIRQFNLFQNMSFFWMVLLLLTWFFLGWNYKMHALPEWFPNVQLLPMTLIQYLYRGLTAIIAVIVIFGISERLLNGNNILNKMMAKIGVISLGIYAVHCTFMQTIVTWIIKILPKVSPNWIVLISFVATFILSVMVVVLFRKNNWLSKILLGK